MDVCFLLKFPWAKRGLLTVAIPGLLYLPIGTVTNMLAAVLLLFQIEINDWKDLPYPSNHSEMNRIEDKHKNIKN